MNARYTPCFLLLATLTAQAHGQAYAELDINAIRARFHADGLVGFDPASSTPQFEVPNGGGAHTLYASGLWIGGLSFDSQLKGAATLYEDGHDLFPGPLTTDGSASITPDVSQQYDHVWSVTRADVLAHLAYYNCLNDPNCDVAAEYPNGYDIPASILDWPAININPGYSTYLAPFFDYNQDGNYIPSDGDAPCMLGDQALFMVFNDKLTMHTLSGCGPIGLEIQSMPFAYNSLGPALDETVFVRYHLINRGTQTLTDVWIGQFNDFDIGCGEDDRLGTDPSRNLCFVYNADNEDENCNGNQGYGSLPPAMGSVLIKGPIMDYNGLDDAADNSLPGWNGTGFGDSMIDNERHGLSRSVYFRRDGPSTMNDPSICTHYYNYLRSYWKDGTPFTYDGDAYDPGNPGAIPARFVFPGDEDPFGAGTDGVPQPPWSQESAGLTPEDSRILGVTGPITLEPGMHIDLVLAYVYARASSGGGQPSVAALQSRVDSVRAFANTLPFWNSFSGNGFFDQCQDYPSVGVDEQEGERLHLFPVPASETVQLDVPYTLAGTTLRIVDAAGRVVATQRLVGGMNTIGIGPLAQGVYGCEVRTAQARYLGRIVKE